jgi:hypothetical protein
VTLPVHAPEHLAAGFELLAAVCPEVVFRLRENGKVKTEDKDK